MWDFGAVRYTQASYCNYNYYLRMPTTDQGFHWQWHFSVLSSASVFIHTIYQKIPADTISKLDTEMFHRGSKVCSAGAGFCTLWVLASSFSLFNRPSFPVLHMYYRITVKTNIKTQRNINQQKTHPEKNHKLTILLIIRAHHIHCVRCGLLLQTAVWSFRVTVSTGHICEPYKNGWTDWDVWGLTCVWVQGTMYKMGSRSDKSKEVVTRRQRQWCGLLSKVWPCV